MWIAAAFLYQIFENIEPGYGKYGVAIVWVFNLLDAKYSVPKGETVEETETVDDSYDKEMD